MGLLELLLALPLFEVLEPDLTSLLLECVPFVFLSCFSASRNRRQHILISTYQTLNLTHWRNLQFQLVEFL